MAESNGCYQNHYALLLAAFGVSLCLLDACGRPDEREVQTRKSLEQKVAAESQGAMTVAGFAKTNGYDQVVGGTPMHVVEWKAHVATMQDLEAKGLAKGTLMEWTGDATLRTTEKGWRVEVLNVTASRIVCDTVASSASAVTPREFGGRWKKEEKKGGQMLGNVLLIASSGQGAVHVREELPLMENATFRDITMDGEMLCGTYIVWGDNEHAFRFRIKSLSPDKIRYSDERGEELFVRQPSPFLGKWAGYQTSYRPVQEANGKVRNDPVIDATPSFEFSIGQENGAFLVTWTWTASVLKGKQTWSGHEDNGKLIANGQAKDFYKFAIPTLQPLADGNLKYSDGANELVLKRSK